jgi:hypothetical protein
MIEIEIEIESGGGAALVACDYLDIYICVCVFFVKFERDGDGEYVIKYIYN